MASVPAVRTRFAPSPTGDLHLGGAWTALASWVWGRGAPGVSILIRIEDLDTARVIRGTEERILDDLGWLGLDWDGRPVRQKERGAFYESALAALGHAKLRYPCDCSRAEIARAAASAPHAGDEAVYPGTCRDRDPARAMRKPPALRVRVPDEVVGYDDGILGPFEQNLARDVGDFVLRRGDGAFAYQFAVVLDDVVMRVTDVVRGADLVPSTPRQVWLAGVPGGIGAPIRPCPPRRGPRWDAAPRSVRDPSRSARSATPGMAPARIVPVSSPSELGPRADERPP